ncbi:Protein CRH-2 a, partial [Aphelenchoides avenae]
MEEDWAPIMKEDFFFSGIRCTSPSTSDGMGGEAKLSDPFSPQQQDLYGSQGISPCSSYMSCSPDDVASSLGSAPVPSDQFSTGAADANAFSGALEGCFLQLDYSHLAGGLAGMDPATASGPPSFPSTCCYMPSDGMETIVVKEETCEDASNLSSGAEYSDSGYSGYGDAEQDPLSFRPFRTYQPRCHRSNASSPSITPPLIDRKYLPVPPGRNRTKMHDLAVKHRLITDQNARSSGAVILSPEEKRTLVQEGYSIPTRLPLTREEEESLKIVRRKIKNK